MTRTSCDSEEIFNEALDLPEAEDAQLPGVGVQAAGLDLESH